MSNREDGTPLEGVGERRFRLGAYATGNYMCQCIRCNEGFIGDKRALNCLSCAAEDAAAQLASLHAVVGAYANADEYRSTMPDDEGDAEYLRQGAAHWARLASEWAGADLIDQCIRDADHRQQNDPAVVEKMRAIHAELSAIIARQALNPDGTGGGR